MKGKRNNVTVTVAGAGELVEALTLMTNTMRGVVLRKAVAKAGRILVNPLRQATPVSKNKTGVTTPSGTTRKSTAIVVRTRQGSASAVVGHRRLPGVTTGRGSAAHLVDLGTKQRATKKGANRGAVAARNYRQPVVDAHKAQVQARLTSELKLGIGVAVEKGAMKALKKAVNR